MPRKEPRDYEEEYRTYHGKPKQVANRATRNAARAKMAKAGRVHKGDGKEVDHKRGVAKGNGRKNLQVMSRTANRRKG
jgi:hypothetical protein